MQAAEVQSAEILERLFYFGALHLICLHHFFTTTILRRCRFQIQMNYQQRIK